MFSSDEKEILRLLVSRQLEEFLSTEKRVAPESSVGFLKAGHDYEHLLKSLLVKLK